MRKRIIGNRFRDRPGVAWLGGAELMHRPGGWPHSVLEVQG